MMGVNTDNLDLLIKKNNSYANSYNTNSKKLISTINELNSCYIGSSLQYLFRGPGEEIKNIQTILGIVTSYSNMLTAVKKGYQSEDANLKAQMNRINLKL